jgi:ribosome-binding factor A
LEKRGKKYHRERLGQALREEIATILEGELGDPRIGLVNVSSVILASDGKSARVMVNVEGDDAEAGRAMEGLSSAVGYVRREVGARLQLRRPPELVFVLDRSAQFSSRVEELLSRNKKRSTTRLSEKPSSNKG